MIDNLVSALNSRHLGAPTKLKNAKPVKGSRALQSSKSAYQQSAAKEPAKIAFDQKLTDFSLQFKLDPESNEVTIFILDRESKEVIRSIPPDELEKLKAGELLELFI